MRGQIQKVELEPIGPRKAAPHRVGRNPPILCDDPEFSGSRGRPGNAASSAARSDAALGNWGVAMVAAGLRGGGMGSGPELNDVERGGRG
jgi:hypothetical protein